MSRSLKNISVVAGATMVSRVLGLARDILISAVFGISALNSSFVTAFTLPNLFRRLLGEGALTAAFVPTLNEELAQRQRAGAFVLVSQVASWLLVVTVAVVALSTWGLFHADFWAARAQAWGLSPATAERWLTGADLAVLLFPYMIFVCLAAAFSAALQTLDRFLEPALSPIWLNLAMIGMLAGGAYLGWAEGDDGRMRWLCAGVLLGGFLQMAVPAVTLVRLGWRPAFDLRASPQVRAIVRLMGPTVFGSAIYLINMAVSRVIGLSLNDAAASVLNLATRLMELPIGVFAVAVSTVVFPLISKYAVQGDWTNLAAAYRKGMRLILVINIPAALGLVVLAEPVIRLLFQRGAFRAEDTALMIPVLAVFALGLPLFSFVNLVLRVFYAERDTRTPVQAAILSFVVNVGLSFALMGPLSTIGLAIAGNVAIAVQAWFLQSRLARKRDSLGFNHLGPSLVRVLAAAAGMGLVVAVAWRGLLAGLGSGVLTDVLALVVLIPSGVAVYGALLWAMKIEGRDDLVALVDRLKARLRPAR
ncbi:MAG TPA: murein biosynthesis integral membrane protein MurJ [Opitutaceae bacterium]